MLNCAGRPTLAELRELYVSAPYLYQSLPIAVLYDGDICGYCLLPLSG